jgi:excisionase family DNA binding protein
MPTTATPKLLTIPEVAKQLRCSRDSVYRSIKRGELPAVRLGRPDGQGPLRVDADELEAWLYGDPAEARS